MQFQIKALATAALLSSIAVIAPPSAHATVFFGIGDVNTLAEQVNDLTHAPIGSNVPVSYNSDGGITLVDTPGLAAVDTTIFGAANLSWAPIGTGYTTVLRTDGERINLLSFSAATFLHAPFGTVDLFWRARNGATILGSGEFSALTTQFQTFFVSTDTNGFVDLDLYGTFAGGGFDPDHQTPDLVILDSFRGTTGLDLGDDPHGPPFTPPGVPEPGTWALLIGGFGLAGVALRRRTLWSDHKAV